MHPIGSEHTWYSDLGFYVEFSHERKEFLGETMPTGLAQEMYKISQKYFVVPGRKNVIPTCGLRSKREPA